MPGAKQPNRAGVMFLVVLALFTACGCGPGGRAVWSFLIPGVGQFMNREAGKGALMLGLSLANETCNTHSDSRNIVRWGVRVWSAADAYGVADSEGLTAAPERETPLVGVLVPLGRQVGMSYSF